MSWPGTRPSRERTTDRTVFIVVDAYSSSASGAFDLVTVLAP
jgi:hypothetical protein